MWRTQWHWVNTTLFFPYPKGSWCFLHDWRSRGFCPAGGNHCTRSMEMRKEIFLSSVRASGHCPNPQQGIYPLVSTHFNLILHLLSCPSPAGFFFTNEIPESSAQNPAQQKMHWVLPITLKKKSGGYFGEGTENGESTQKDLLNFFSKIILLTLNHSDLYFTRLQPNWANLVIYIFSNLITFTQRFLFEQQKSQHFPLGTRLQNGIAGWC